MLWFKVFLVSAIFYYIFGQNLNLLNFIGIIFWGLWIVFIMLSKSGFVFDKVSWNFILSAIFTLIMAVLQVLKDTVMKYYFWYGENDVNIVHFKVFHDTFLYSLIVLVGVYWLWGDFDYPVGVLIFSSIWGFLHILSSLFHNFIIVRSMAGPAEVLMSTSNPMHIVIDFVIFGGKINAMQIIGIAFSFLSTVWVIFGNKH